MYIDQTNQELMLKLTSIIKCTYQNKDPQQATCFFCKKENGKVILITNKHVLENALTAQLYLTVLTNQTNTTSNYYISINLSLAEVKLHSEYDIATLNYSLVEESLKKQNLQPHITTLNEIGILTNYDSLDIIQDILMIGYPDGLINKPDNAPITRTGITATAINSNYLGNNLFLTDVPTFGGSSGSPILIATSEGKIRLVGINFKTYLHEVPVYDKKYGESDRNIIGYTSIPNDIGVAVNSRVIKEMVDLY